MRSYISYIFVLCWAVSWSQDGFEAPLTNLSIPNSPAFVILDEAPSLIERSGTPKALGAELLQSFDGGTFDNIAVEFSPFWLSKPKKLTYFDLKGLTPTEDGKGLKNKALNPFLNMVVSFAHVRNQDTVTNISLGIRTTLIELKHPRDIKRYEEGYKAVNRLFDLKNSIQRDFGNEQLQRDDPQEYQKQFSVYYKDRLAEIAVEQQVTAAAILDTLVIKPIFALDVAAAFAHRFYNNTFKGSSDQRYGFWATAEFALPIGREFNNTNYLNAYAFARYLRDEAGIFGFNTIDIGVKAELQLSKIFIGYEYIHRSGDITDFRSVGNLRYILNNKIQLVGSFGNNFNDFNDLVSTLGIRWGFDSKDQKVNFVEN